jgi:Yip1 domain
MMERAGGMDVNSLMQRLRRLAMLDTTVFDEVKSDTNSTIPAIVVVAVATLLAGIGGWLFNIEQTYHYSSGQFFLKSAILGSILAIIVWAIGWLGVTYVMLTQVFRARADINELLRVMGFAAAPLALTVGMVIPGLDYGIGLAALGLTFGTTQIAIQSATDAPSGKALIANAAGFAVWVIVVQLFVGATNTYAPGVFIFAPR